MVNTAVCVHCGHRWVSRSKSPWITCSRCQRKHKREAVVLTVHGAPAAYPGPVRCQVCDALVPVLVPAALGDEPVLACRACVGRGPSRP